LKYKEKSKSKENLDLRSFRKHLTEFFVLQTHLTKWVRVHRTHHRYTETSADPHNSNRGFFFSHVGWLMMKHHPAVKHYGKNVDVSDLAADPVISFFDK